MILHDFGDLKPESFKNCQKVFGELEAYHSFAMSWESFCVFSGISKILGKISRFREF